MLKHSSLLLLFLIFFYAFVTGQTPGIKRCATDEQMEHLFKVNPSAKARYIAYQKQIEEKLAQLKSIPNNELELRTTAIITIPVVVHVLVANAQLVTDAVVQKQLDTLNWYYGGQSNNDSLRVYEPFRTSFGRTQIRFCLAKRDPNGQPTSGITRKNNATTYNRFSNDMKNSQTGGQTAWDTRSYLNMWVVQYNDGTLGGAYLPGAFQPGDNNIGYVVDYRAFGSGATYLYPEYNGGKTAVHEIGHYLNLLHPWGNLNDNANCNQSDFIADTPPTAGPTFGCPGFPALDNCAPPTTGKMSQNHMDYVDDACMVLFTKNQATRMELALNTLPDRVTLITSDKCVVPIVPNRDASPTSLISPDSIQCDPANIRPIVQLNNFGLDTIKSLTLNYTLNGGSINTINYTGSIPFLQNVPINLTSANLNIGINIYKVYISRVNGLNDEKTSNDTLIFTIRILNTVNDSLVESFEGVFPPKDWTVTQLPIDNITWKKNTTAGNNSLSSAYINNFNYAANNKIDNLVTPPIKYAGADSVFLSFDIAASTFSFPGSTAIPLDTLEVLASTDCGKTFTSIYKKWGYELQTIGDPNNVNVDEFFPRNVEQWRRDSINLTRLLGSNNSVQFTFRNTTNYENNIFIDNVNFSKKVLPAKLKTNGVLISPNPFRSQFVVQHYLPPTNLKGYILFNSIGQKVLQNSFSSGTAQSYFTVNTSHLPPGVYTLQLIYNDRSNSFRLMKMN